MIKICKFNFFKQKITSSGQDVNKTKYSALSLTL